MSDWDLAPRLRGDRVVLEPLAERHFAALADAARPPEIWTWWPVDLSTGEAAVRAWFDAALLAREAGERAHFATLDAATGAPIGSTSFMNLRPADEVLEIGWTWLTPGAWSTGANAQAKHLMLRHAFEALGVARVEFFTDERNERSRRALAALPAQLEGIMREHRLLVSGRRRSSAVFSILAAEWPAVDAHLTARLAR